MVKLSRLPWANGGLTHNVQLSALVFTKAVDVKITGEIFQRMLVAGPFTGCRLLREHEKFTGPVGKIQELKKQFANASVVGNDRAVFNIKGNYYRLVVAIDFEKQITWIRFIGSHKQYDKINAKTV